MIGITSSYDLATEASNNINMSSTNTFIPGRTSALLVQETLSTTGTTTATAWIRSATTRLTGDVLIRTTQSDERHYCDEFEASSPPSYSCSELTLHNKTEHDLFSFRYSPPYETPIIADALGPLSFEAMSKLNCQQESLAKMARTDGRRS